MQSINSTAGMRAVSGASRACGVALLLLAGSAASAGQWATTAASGQKVQIVAEESSGGAKLYVERRQADGKPDPHFGVRGRVAITMGPDNEPPSGLVLDDAGNVIVIGATQSLSGATQPVLLRLVPGGDPDRAWGVGGRSTDAPASGNARAFDALPLRDGRLLVVGTLEVDGDEHAVAWHLDANGRLDTSAAPASRFMLARLASSRAVSLTSVGDTQVILGVRVLADADMLLEGHSFDTGDANAMPKLVSRQPWPSAWTDAPVWLARAAPGWGDAANPGAAVAAVSVAPTASAVDWKPLAPGATKAAAADRRELGDASINPQLNTDRTPTAITDAPFEVPWWGWLVVATIALGAVAASWYCNARRRAVVEVGFQRERARPHDY